MRRDGLAARRYSSQLPQESAAKVDRKVYWKMDIAEFADMSSNNTHRSGVSGKEACREIVVDRRKAFSFSNRSRIKFVKLSLRVESHRPPLLQSGL